MRKNIALFFIISNFIPLTCQTFQINVSQEHLTDIKVFNNVFDDKNQYNADGTINWNTFSDNAINKFSQTFKNNSNHQLAATDIASINANVKSLTNQFQTAQLTNAEQAKNYLLNNQYFQNHDKFQQYFQNPELSYQSDYNQIMTKYFGQAPVDLKLDGMQTYQDAVNCLLVKVNQDYPHHKVAIKLTNDTDANLTLFNNRDISHIIAFDLNQITLNVTITIDNEQPMDTHLRLTKLLLDQNRDSMPLYQAIKAYFDPSFPLKLNLKATDTVKSALDLIIQTIENRFQIIIPEDGTVGDHISMTFLPGIVQPHQLTLQSKLTDTDLINDAFTGNFYFNVSLIDQDLKSFPNYDPIADFKISFYLPHIQFDPISLKLLLNLLFSEENSRSNPQNLILTTANTFQTACDKLQKKLNNNSQSYQIQAVLSNPAIAKEKFETQFNPAAPTQSFLINVNISYTSSTNPNSTILGQYRIYLNDVILDQTSQKKLITFQAFQIVSTELDQWNDALEYTSCTCALLAAACWIADYFDCGASSIFAIGFTITSIITGIGSCVLDLDICNSNNAMSRWTKVGFETEDIYNLGQTFYWSYLLYLAAAEISLGAYDWISLGAGTVLVFLELIAAILADSGIIH